MLDGIWILDGVYDLLKEHFDTLKQAFLLS